MASSSLLGSLNLILGADTAVLEKALKGAEASLRRIAAVGTAVGNVLSTAIVSAFRAIKDGVTEAIKAAEELGKLSDRVGIAAGELSKLQFAARNVGTSAQTLSDGLTSLSDKMREAFIDDASEAARTFEAMGIAITDASGQLRSTQDVLLEVANRFQGYQDGVQESIIATNLFGNAAREILPFLNQGANEIQRLGAEGQRTGQTISNETVAAATRLNNQMREIGSRIQAVFMQLAQAFLPSLLQLADALSSSASSGGSLRVAIDALGAALRAVATVLISTTAVVDVFAGSVRRLGLILAGISTRNVRLLGQAFASSLSDIETRAAEATRRIQELWSATNGLSGAVGKLGIAGQTIAPVVASTRDLADAARRAQDEARAALDAIVNAPTETFVNKMRAIEQALRDGTITMRQFGEMTRRVQRENQQHMLDLGTAVANALTTIFGKNKTAAIAAAIINTAVGITRALSTLPPPFSWAQAALIAATGAAQIATIKSTNMSGSGSAPTVSGSGGQEQQAGPVQTLMVQGINPNQIFTGQYMRDFAQQLLDFQRDGGVVVLK